MSFRSRPELDAQRLRVEAIGEPGQRRFRLLAVVGGETTIVWMEKQQLQALGLALEQLLTQLPDGGPVLSPTAEPVEFDTATRRQFRAGRMELGYDERQDRIVVVAHDLNEDEEDDPVSGGGGDENGDFACRITREQAREISADAAAVVSAGRPRCTMCGNPMGPGPHVCPQQNGHYPHALGETEQDVDAV
ncbi:MAG: hypothetical protein AVDCRST_MAG19-3014 [uncultured Thermomicrobiales bacterium]|uniref:DUF3090 family protein n=1 Tax=uncultured Thermomicrobiales bacterium TaxID=1645740 RepID=A0A6J4VAN9_9BACT|nr:MAG: hypothetical protein AVDCRST_MAG19-3014 [uncultured Thermomicrobiales bacterium]